MGVHGLWRLIEPSGKPVPLETLENKVLAVDISIWLHQAIKGFQDSKGGAVPNAHLLGIYHRVCKLLYFKIKPVFIFDGGVPALKKQTIAKRNQSKSKNLSDAEKIQKQLLATLIKHSAINKVLSEKVEEAVNTATVSVKKSARQTTKDNLYVLPVTDFDSTLSSSEDESESTSDSSPTKHWDLHNIDTRSVHFKSLPADVRHEILTDLKETRKQSSWGRLHELPTFSDDFAQYQMNRLLKRQAVQSALEETEKEMGGHSLSLAELESLLKDQGVITKPNVGNRIASDENKRYLLIKDTKKAMDDARKDNEKLATVEEADNEESQAEKAITKADKEFAEDLQAAITLSLQESETSQPSTSRNSSKSPSSSINTDAQFIRKNKLEFSFLENFTDADFVSSSDEGEGFLEISEGPKTLSSAQSYMMEYSGLTPSEIDKIIGQNSKGKSKDKQNMSRSTDSDNSIEIKGRRNQCEVVATSSSTDGSRNESNVCSAKENTTNIERSVTSTKLANKADDIADYRQKLNKIQEVQIMSSASSSDAEDFVEINEQIDISHSGENKNIVEVIINLNEEVAKEDDLFSDIFESKDTNVNATDVIPNMSNDDQSGNQSLKPDEFVKHKKMGDVNQGIEHYADDSKLIKENKEEYEEASQGVNIVTQDQRVINNKESLDNLSHQESRKETENEIILNKPAIKPVHDKEINLDISSKKPTVSVEELQKMKDELQKETNALITEKATKERMAGNMTDQIYQESQELLSLFGVPYIIAPMEAEAQCAFLDEINLTDGTITDDSDIWLFGGKTVYKNFFNQAKYVLEFKAENIEHHFKLTREQMILLALLVGSDYTVGLQGVGPVTALEILSTFPPSSLTGLKLSQNQLISGLAEFRSWFKKGKTAGPGRNALKNKLKNISFTDNFPSTQVVQAYLEPTVDTSKEPFSWGKPDVMGLTEFARIKFGWTKMKTEEILRPVLKRMEEGRVQKTIKDFFKVTCKVDSGDVVSKMSKRVRTAIDNIGKDPSERILEELEEVKRKSSKKPRKRSSVNDGAETSKPKQIRKKRNDDNLDADNESEELQINKSKSRQKVKTKDVAYTEENQLKDTARRNRNDDNLDADNEGEKTEEPQINKSKSRQKVKTKDVADTEENQLKDTESKPKRTRKSQTETKAKLASSTNLETLTPEESKQPSESERLEGNPEDNILDKIQTIRNRRRLKDALAPREARKQKTEAKKAQIQSVVGDISEDLVADSEVRLLQEVASTSAERVEQIASQIQEKINHITAASSKRPVESSAEARKTRMLSTIVHKKESIPQKDRDRSTLLRNKLKAIEVFRKSKKGPGYVQKRTNKRKAAKEDAGLSESSDD